MYFAFLGFYTLALVPPAVLGVVATFFNYDVFTQIAFCAMNLIWATLFLEMWKRYAASLAYKWGSLGDAKFEPARAEYYGTLGTNPVTGRLELTYPKKKRMLMFYFVTLPILITCLFFAVSVMLMYFNIQEAVNEYHFIEDTCFSNFLLRVPSPIYATIICVMNIGYRKLAQVLNDLGQFIAYISSYEWRIFDKCFSCRYYIDRYIDNKL